MRYLIGLGLLFAMSLPVNAFVERLHPNGGEIACHTMRGMIVELINATFTPLQLGNEIETKYLCGPDFICTGGEGWTAQDNTDNSALVALINGQSVADQILTALRVESLCFLWEQGVHPVIDSPAEFRVLLGID